MCNRLNTRTVVLFLQETATSLPTLELFVRMKSHSSVIHIFLHSRKDEFQTRTARVRMPVYVSGTIGKKNVQKN